MTDLLLLGCGSEHTLELASIFQQAGYQVNEVSDVVACCRRLQAEFRQPPFISIPVSETPRETGLPKGITILDARAIATQANAQLHQPQLLTCIMSLARQLAPGWRLSMRHRYLEAPAGQRTELTSLEFNFIKIFAMTEMGEAVSRKQIVQSFGEDYLSYDQNRLDTMVRRLRKKIDSQMGIKLPLNTERVRGFSFGDILIIDP